MSANVMSTVEVVEAIDRERGRLYAALDALGSRASSLAVTGEGWTAKDTLAHMIHWATAVAYGLGADVPQPVYMIAERMRRKAAGLPDTMPTGEESNALAVAHFREVPLSDVRAQFDQLVEIIIERVRERADDEINAAHTIPWARPRPLWQFIGGDTFLHWPVHSEMIERAAGS